MVDLRSRLRVLVQPIRDAGWDLKEFSGGWAGGVYSLYAVLERDGFQLYVELFDEGYVGLWAAPSDQETDLDDPPGPVFDGDPEILLSVLTEEGWLSNPWEAWTRITEE
jgi:hypothetical protein